MKNCILTDTGTYHLLCDYANTPKTHTIYINESLHICIHTHIYVCIYVYICAFEKKYVYIILIIVLPADNRTWQK